jgi:nitrite reductase/ring-hydroxylating ferredoxin subunit
MRWILLEITLFCPCKIAYTLWVCRIDSREIERILIDNICTMTNPYPVCHKEDIPENGSKGFSIEARTGEIEFFVVRKNNHYFAYVNSCPHTNINLEWVPDQFLDMNNNLIQCSLHGAKFMIEDGYCISGPCQGQKLKALDVRIEDDYLQLFTDY